MCVHTSNEMDVSTVGRRMIEENVPIESIQFPNKFTKAKEKCMKVYDEMVERESSAGKSSEDDNGHAIGHPNLADDLLAKSTAKYGNLATRVVQYYENFQGSHAYK